MVLLALVLTPLVAVNAQGRDDKCKDKPAVNPAGQVRGNSAAARAAAPGQVKKGCDVAPPPVTPPPAEPPPPTTVETAEISGTAFSDVDASFTWSSGEVGLEGWTIQLSGPVTATTVTDVSGAYSFIGLPVGTYLVCEAPQIGWWQSLPMDGAVCASGMMGYVRVVSADAPGARFIGNDFGNVPIGF
jgi:hypothetical protein